MMVKMTEELQMFKLAVENASDHIIITNSEGIIVFANKAVEKITGFTPEEVVGKKAGSKGLWGGQMDGKFYEEMWKKIKIDKEPFRAEIVNKRKNGELYECDLAITPVLSGEDVVEFYVGVERDISKEKTAIRTREALFNREYELERKERDFVAVASHQLLTPLALIKGYLSLLLRGRITDSKKLRYMKEVSLGATRMDKLIKQLLEISRIERGVLKMEKRKFGLGKLAREVARELKEKAKRAGVKLVIGKKREVVVWADKVFTREVVVNLIDNAIKFTPQGGSVMIDWPSGGQLSVTDTGAGIAESDQGRIFDKFYKSENWVKHESTSSGLGLYIAKSLVEMMGGTIKVESMPGRGSVFSFVLPKQKK